LVLGLRRTVRERGDRLVWPRLTHMNVAVFQVQLTLEQSIRDERKVKGFEAGGIYLGEVKQSRYHGRTLRLTSNLYRQLSYF
jgi:hypothetical protein